MSEGGSRLLSRRRFLGCAGLMPWLGGLSRAAVPASARKRLGWMAHVGPKEGTDDWDTSRSKDLESLGFFAGKTLDYVVRFASWDRSRYMDMAREIVAARPHAIFASGAEQVRALRRFTTTIPIGAIVEDPVGAGLAASLAKPGGNVTGVSYNLRESVAKQVEVLRFLLPRLAAVVVISPPRFLWLDDIGTPTLNACRRAGVAPSLRLVNSMSEVEAAFRELPAGGRGAAVILGEGRFDEYRYGTRDANFRSIQELALKMRVPSAVQSEKWVRDGALFSYAFEFGAHQLRVFQIVGKLLEGANPATMPFELATHSRFVINSATAQRLGIPVSQELLLRADKVVG